MAKLLFTFGVGSPYRQNCVVVDCDDEIKAREYVYTKYGQENTCGVYDYELFSYLIKMYNYKIIEKVAMKE